MGAAVERKVLAVKEAAVMLGVTRNHIYALCRAPRLRHVRLGRRVVIPKDAVEDLLAGRMDANANKPKD